MSDPKNDPIFDIDQLLSDHLDGWLEGDDLLAFQDKLAHDEDLRNRYEALLADQSHLREMFRQDQSASARLPAGFATAIAAEASRQRGPSVSRLNRDSTRSSRWVIAGIVATAAALLLIANLNTTETPDSGLAQNGIQPLVAFEPTKPQTEGTIPTDTVVESEAAINLLADNAPVVPTPKVDTGVKATQNQPASKPPMDRIARATKTAPPAKSNPVVNPLQNSAAVSVQPELDQSMSGAVLVYDVRLTTQGRVTQCVAKTMKQVGMPETSRQPIDGDLVDAAKSVEAFDEESKFQLLYLRAPAKQLDRLFASLLRDRKNVTSLALSLVTDSPILKVTDNLRSVDPTLIQHDRNSASLELQADDASELAVLRRLLDDQTFLPLSPGMPTTTGLNGFEADASSGSGRDVMSRVLLIVR